MLKKLNSDEIGKIFGGIKVKDDDYCGPESEKVQALMTIFMGEIMLWASENPELAKEKFTDEIMQKISDALGDCEMSELSKKLINDKIMEFTGIDLGLK